MTATRLPALALFLVASLWLGGSTGTAGSTGSTGTAGSAGSAGGTKSDKKAHDMHGKHFDECAKACTTCMRECESCALHCANLLAKGKKDHLKTLGTCMDCANFCAAAARIVAHRGPLSGIICESCAKACDACGKACEAHADDAHMKQCAQACRDCARACREMLEHTAMMRNDAKTEKR